MPPTLDASPCPACNGSGNCPRCEAEHRPPLECRACESTGVCAECRGTGRRVVFLPTVRLANPGAAS